MYMQYLRAGKVLYSQTFHGYPLSDSNQKRPSSVHLLQKKLAHQSTGTKGMCIANCLGKRSTRLVRMGHGYNYGNGEETLYYRRFGQGSLRTVYERKSWRYVYIPYHVNPDVCWDIGIEFLEEHDGCATDILLPQQASSGFPLLQICERVAMSPEPHIQTPESEDVSTEGQSSVDTVFHANFVTQRVRVPQEIYASKDRTFKPRVISAFRIHGAAGIPLAAILRGETEGLEGRALPALPDDMTCTKVSLRILWPGYEPFTKQIMIRTGGRTVSMDRLVEVIAKVLVEFCQKRALVPTSDPAWRLGPGSITVDDMTLPNLYTWSANTENGPAAAVDLEKACRENNGGASLKIGSSKHAEVDTIVGNAIVNTHCVSFRDQETQTQGVQSRCRHKCNAMVYAVTAFVIKSTNIENDADVEGE
ncbi:predicted protein [Postia placenta Mad-698-R]|uniref:Uncharacterized protein n=1 Tax=Postia placenta MAD-698-R-SB12 TaxID=670580 RepID=A0A1X6MJC4_9APHY|nr:hypothetical protein POSPLADRAFT_1175320 [Postia placenta MAD-698-R-SB12]EED83697.1 predicted protein [Postia placenta Mad-698-R]OSX56262.1 hypothetical protein POSPLADRAFT_1175320 [Postia placenta MAD-698-R-SB12]